MPIGISLPLPILLPLLNSLPMPISWPFCPTRELPKQVHYQQEGKLCIPQCLRLSL